MMHCHFRWHFFVKSEEMSFIMGFSWGLTSLSFFFYISDLILLSASSGWPFYAILSVLDLWLLEMNDPVLPLSPWDSIDPRSCFWWSICFTSIVHWGNFISSSIVFCHGQLWFFFLILLILFPLFLLGLLVVCLGASVCSMYCGMSLFAAVIVCFYF